MDKEDSKEVSCVYITCEQRLLTSGIGHDLVSPLTAYIEWRLFYKSISSIYLKGTVRRHWLLNIYGGYVPTFCSVLLPYCSAACQMLSLGSTCSFLCLKRFVKIQIHVFLLFHPSVYFYGLPS